MHNFVKQFVRQFQFMQHLPWQQAPASCTLT